MKREGKARLAGIVRPPSGNGAAGSVGTLFIQQVLRFGLEAAYSHTRGNSSCRAEGSSTTKRCKTRVLHL